MESIPYSDLGGKCGKSSHDVPEGQLPENSELFSMLSHLLDPGATELIIGTFSGGVDTSLHFSDYADAPVNDTHISQKVAPVKACSACDLEHGAPRSPTKTTHMYCAYHGFSVCSRAYVKRCMSLLQAMHIASPHRAVAALLLRWDDQLTALDACVTHDAQSVALVNALRTDMLALANQNLIASLGLPLAPESLAASANGVRDVSRTLPQGVVTC